MVAYASIVRPACWVLKERPSYLVKCGHERTGLTTYEYVDHLGADTEIVLFVQVDATRVSEINQSIIYVFSKYFTGSNGRYEGDVGAMVYALSSIVTNKPVDSFTVQSLPYSAKCESYMYLLKLPHENGQIKIGVTMHMTPSKRADIKRVNSYKDREILLVLQVHRSVMWRVETRLVERFVGQYRQNKREYFIDGDRDSMLEDIFEMVAYHAVPHINLQEMVATQAQVQPKDDCSVYGTYGYFSEDSLRRVVRRYLEQQTLHVIITGEEGIYEELLAQGLDTKGKDFIASKDFIRKYLLGKFESSGGVEILCGRVRPYTYQYRMVKSTILGVMDGSLPVNNGQIKSFPVEYKCIKHVGNSRKRCRVDNKR